MPDENGHYTLSINPMWARVITGLLTTMIVATCSATIYLYRSTFDQQNQIERNREAIELNEERIQKRATKQEVGALQEQIVLRLDDILYRVKRIEQQQDRDR